MYIPNIDTSYCANHVAWCRLINNDEMALARIDQIDLTLCGVLPLYDTIALKPFSHACMQNKSNI